MRKTSRAGSLPAVAFRPVRAPDEGCSPAAILAKFREVHRRYSDPRAPAALYPAEVGFHPFTNEPGLGRTLSEISVEGGAAVSVGGAMLDVAARCRSDWGVAIDSNPRIADAMQVFIGLLLWADQEGDRRGWSDEVRAVQVFKRLETKFRSDEAAHVPYLDTARLLIRLGVRVGGLAATRELLRDIGHDLVFCPRGTWLRSEDRGAGETPHRARPRGPPAVHHHQCFGT